MTAAQAWLFAILLSSGNRQAMDPSTSPTPACVNAAARLYQLPPLVIEATLDVQGGHIGQAVADSNGTFDIGPMQINSSWLPELHRDFGITLPQLLYDGCLNVSTGAWILKRYMLESRDFWTGVAWYQSHHARNGVAYALKVWRAALRRGNSQWVPSNLALDRDRYARNYAAGGRYGRRGRRLP